MAENAKGVHEWINFVENRYFKENLGDVKNNILIWHTTATWQKEKGSLSASILEIINLTFPWYEVKFIDELFSLVTLQLQSTGFRV